MRPSPRPGILPRLRRAFALLLLVAILAVALLQAGYYLRIRELAQDNPSTTAFMQLRQEQRRAAGRDPRLAHEWVGYDRISPWLKRAVIAAEDARFVDHNGIDWTALREAFMDNRAAGEVVRGGSTISQQLAKNLFLSPERSYWRKGQEALLALMLDATLSKRRILELYLNLIEWGDGVFGVEAAAAHYYGIGAHQLGRWQASMLAARIPRPRYYSERGATPYLFRRAGDIYGWADMVRVPR
ncbi:MAG: monofunctional biosynthetic peptidoglycan transglycosylase [Halofilum sp. (in: g-proteobacteria)]|nr:monofunctional biosynthetic peptidoglycan transglycosylase [Halofilum sp. (in: g-proteobacteria)]